MLNAGFVARADASDDSARWKLDGEVIWLSITDAGREAIGKVNDDLASALGGKPATAGEADTADDEPTFDQEPPVTPHGPQHRPKLGDAAAALLPAETRRQNASSWRMP